MGRKYFNNLKLNYYLNKPRKTLIFYIYFTFTLNETTAYLMTGEL